MGFFGSKKKHHEDKPMEVIQRKMQEQHSREMHAAHEEREAVHKVGEHVGAMSSQVTELRQTVSDLDAELDRARANETQLRKALQLAADRLHRVLCQHCVELLPAGLHHGEALLDRDVKRRVSAHRFPSQGSNCLAAAKVVSKLVEALVNDDRGVDIKADGVGHAQRRLRTLDAQARHMPQRRVRSPSCCASKAAYESSDHERLDTKLLRAVPAACFDVTKLSCIFSIAGFGMTGKKAR